MAKERAERQSGQSTHARERITPAESVSRTLSALRAKAQEEPEHRFRALARLLDQQMLRESFGCMKRGASPGIDGVSCAKYAEDLDENLRALEERLRKGRYRTRCVKRRWISKAGGRKRRPLGILVLEDKIVQHAVKGILEAIWEPDFHDESIGYRAGRGARQSSLELREALNGGSYCWVVEADIRGFFDHMDHGWLVRMLEQRIADSSLVKFNRREPESSGKFTFLGFDFYWARSRRNPRFVFVKRRTNREKFRASLRALKEWIKKERCRNFKDLLRGLRLRLRGYWNYYGVIGNSTMTGKYYREVVRLLYKWLNRRSQRRSMTWSSFLRRLPGWELPPPRVVETPPNPGLH